MTVLRVGLLLVAALHAAGCQRAAPAAYDAGIVAPAAAEPAPFPCREDFTCPAGFECVFSRCWPAGRGAADSYVHSPAYQRDADLIRDLIFDALALAPGMRVVDIGTGTGLLARRAARAVGPKGRVLATDINAKAVERLRAAVGDEGLANVDVRLVQGERDHGLDAVPRDSVDRVLLINSAKFGRDDDRAQDLAYLKAIRDRMRRGGELVYHLDWIRASGEDLGVEGAKALFAEAGLTFARELPQPAHIPDTSWVYVQGPAGPTRLPLVRGFIVVVRKP